MSDEVRFTLDGREVTVPKGTLIIRAAEAAGVYIPRFCDHPLLDPLGACRQCLVEVEGQRKPLTACTTPVADGMVVKTQFSSDLARDGQEGVLELLLINHPLDCPMCDKGGECPLQDQALAYGPGGSRYIDPKRRFTKPIPISPVIKLDRERCVLCARCTRFADQISGDPFIELFERGALEQVSVSEDDPYLSIFSGNVVQICPVGALTATPYRFRARPFDVVTTPSTCTRCASGCAIDVQTRRGDLVRILAREDLETNDEWICDVGRWGYGYTTHPERVLEPMVRKEDEFVAVTWSEAMRVVAERLGEARQRGATAAVLAGGNLMDEDAYALSRFARAVLGTNDVDARATSGGDEERDVVAAALRAPGAGNADIDRAKVIVVAGSDLHEESPIVFLRVRKAARRGARVVEVSPRRSLAGIGAAWLPCQPGGEAAVLAALAAGLEARGASGLDPWTRAAVTNVDAAAAGGLAGALADAQGAATILVGDRIFASSGAAALAWNVALAAGAAFGWVPRKSGARGAAWAGLHPAFLPGGRLVAEAAERAQVEEAWGTTIPSVPGRDVAGILGMADLGVLYLAGADPAGNAGADARALERAGFVVAHDLFLTETSRRAHVVLPVASAYERAGTVSGWDGRTRAVTAATPTAGLAQTDAEILGALAATLGVAFPGSMQAVRAEMSALALPVGDRRAVPVPTLASEPAVEGLTLLQAPMLIGDGTMMAGADALRATGAGPFVELSEPDAARLGIADGATVVATGTSGEVRAAARVTASIAPGVVFVPAHAGRIGDGPVRVVSA